MVTLGGSITLAQSTPEFAEGLAELQRICFPTLAEAERFKVEHFRKHIELFPEGQFMVLDDDRVIGATTTLRLNFDLERIHHTFAEIIQGGWLTSHNPNGEWLYGADLAVDPAYRGGGIATALYAARHELVRKLGLKGQITAGMIPGYGPLKDRMTAEEYYARVLAGELRDPTLSMQIGVGFEPHGLLENYLHDPACGDYGVLLVLSSEKTVRGAIPPG
ncbi:MAG TPA: GNAT family N-acetyltransferase [Bryobacteraceae bacterium]|nr:GNAT family N-acetyltransferase [Bryobacteraceae bacterium]